MKMEECGELWIEKEGLGRDFHNGHAISSETSLCQGARPCCMRLKDRDEHGKHVDLDSLKESRNEGMNEFKDHAQMLCKGIEIICLEFNHPYLHS